MATPPSKRSRSPSPPVATKKKKEVDDSIYTRTGGAYIPPARLRMLQEQIKDKESAAYQRMSWEALKKSINGLINKVNVSNITDIVRELFQENIVRGRGLLARSVLTAQAASPTFSHVYAALVAIINTKFPQTGELIAKRLIIQFRKSFRRNDKHNCLCSVRFIAHLINQQVVHELLALELLTVLLENPTSDSVEVGIGFLKESGMKLTELSPKGVHGVFETLKSILHDGNVDIRVQYMIEVMFAIRKDHFKEHPSIVEGLDLIQEEDQITHLISLDDEIEGDDTLNVFKYDPSYLENEDKYKAIKEEILGEGSSDDSDEEGETGDEEDSDEEEEGGTGEGEMTIKDETQTDLLGLRRTIYLTLMSSLDFEECAHKVIKMELKPGQENEVANMIIECCSQERSYQRYYGLLGERFCHLEQKWVENFDMAFQQQYATVHRLETNKLRNVAKFFAQLFYTDALPWTSMSCIHLNEDETNSSSRIFVKIVFQELAEYMGLPKLNERLKDPFLSAAFEGILPRDNPRNTRFAINFFTSIGLGGLTDDLREHLKNAPKLIMSQEQNVSSDSDSSSSGSDSDSDSDSDSSDDSSSSESSSSEEERRKRHQKRKQKDKSSARSRDKEKRRRKSSSESEEEKSRHMKKRSNRKEKESSDSEEERKRDRRRGERNGEDRRDRRQRGGDKKVRDRRSRDRDSRNRRDQSRSRSADSEDKKHRSRSRSIDSKDGRKRMEKKGRSREDRQRARRSDSEGEPRRRDRYNGERRRRRHSTDSDKSEGRTRRDDKRDKYHDDRQRREKIRESERENKRRRRDHS